MHISAEWQNLRITVQSIRSTLPPTSDTDAAKLEAAMSLASSALAEVENTMPFVWNSVLDLMEQLRSAQRLQRMLFETLTHCV